MLRVYLDQNKWVDLARARTGHARGAEFEGVWRSLQSAARAGSASFPLSAGHYFETRHRRKYSSRKDLGDTMSELSRWHAIAPPQLVVPVEIDIALKRHADPDGRNPAPLEVFGIGADHALGLDGLVAGMTDTMFAGIALPDGAQQAIREEADNLIQHLVLVGTETDLPGLLDFARLEKDIDKRFAGGQADLAAELSNRGLNRPAELDDAITGTEIADILKPLLQAALARQLDPGDLLDRGRDWLTALLEDIPSRWVTRSMRRARHAQPQQPWTRTDLNDVNALGVAVPYCDVVVTERQWVHHLRRAKFDERFSTRIIADLRELPPLLADSQ